MPFETILVPTDFSDHASEALETAIEIGNNLGSSLHLVHAYYFDIPPAFAYGDATAILNPTDILEPIRANAEAAMVRLVSDLEARGIHAESHVVLGHASEMILAEAARIPASLIVIGTRGLTGLKHILLGSTAERVIRMAPCPVITVKAGTEEKSDRPDA